MKLFDVAITEVKTHVFRVSATSEEAAIAEAETLLADGEDGDVIEVEQTSCDAVSVDEED